MRSKILPFSLPIDLYEHLKAIALEKNNSLAAIIRIAISEYLERNGKIL